MLDDTEFARILKTKMPVNFDEVNTLWNTKIGYGEKWLYSADANDPMLKRIDDEIEDISQISGNGGIAIILAHQGRFGNAKELDFVKQFLEQRLKKRINYFPENNTPKAVEFAKTLKPGDIAVMENTRIHEGEEKNDLGLAKQFASLAGENGKIAIGGFRKAHRKNASNVGILEYLPGYITRSQIKEMKELEEFAGKEEACLCSVAVLGGIKGEKIKDGLLGFAETYNHIIPGGIVLNSLLKARGFEVGASVISDDGKTFENECKDAIKNSKARIHLPKKVVIARKIDVENNMSYYRDVDVISLAKGRGNGVPLDYMIISYIMPESSIEALDEVVEKKGRLVLAGTPDLYKEGIGLATYEVIQRLNKPGVKGLVLGGDSAAEIKYNGKTSLGGGSALHFLAHGTTPVFEALKENKKKYGK